MDWYNGKNRIVSSDARNANDIRGPYVVINIGAYLSGLSTERANCYACKLQDLSCLDYAPNVIDDPLFCGIAVGAERCDMHKLEPRRCVAFDGTNTGRRFYMCQIENQAINCGF